jgi:hypothetical protein
MDRFTDVGIVKNQPITDSSKLENFKRRIEEIKSSSLWHKSDLVELFKSMLPDFEHEEKGKNLDSKM